MSQSKKHHYVPQSILRNFSYKEKYKQIHVFDKQTCKSYLSSIVDAGCENNFNTVTTDDFSLNFEDFFDENDSQLKHICSKIISNKSVTILTEDELQKLFRAVAFQICRTKMMRTSIIDLHDQLIDEITERGWSSKHLPKPSSEEAKLISLMSMIDVEDMITSLQSKVIHLFVAKQSDLWISDNPVVFNNTLPYGERGLKSRGIEVYFPISSRIVIGFVCESYYAEYRNSSNSQLVDQFLGRPILLKDEHIEFFNYLQVQSSSRFLYGSTNDFSLAIDIIKESPQLKDVKSLIKVGKMGEGPPPKKDMPPGTQLVVEGAKLNHMIEIEFNHDTTELEFVTKEVESMKKLEKDSPFQSVTIYENGCLRSLRRDQVINKIDYKEEEVYCEIGFRDIMTAQLMNHFHETRKRLK